MSDKDLLKENLWLLKKNVELIKRNTELKDEKIDDEEELVNYIKMSNYLMDLLIRIRRTYPIHYGECIIEEDIAKLREFTERRRDA